MQADVPEDPEVGAQVEEIGGLRVLEVAHHLGVVAVALDSRLMAALCESWNQAAVRLKSKVSFSSSAVTTRVTSAPRAERAETPSSVSAPRIAQDFRLKVTAFKEAPTITRVDEARL